MATGSVENQTRLDDLNLANLEARSEPAAGGRRLFSTSNQALIRFHLLVVLIGVIVILAVVLIPARIIDSNSRGATEADDMALLASNTQAQSGDVLALLYLHIAPFVSQPQVTSLSAEQQAQLRTELFRRDSGGPLPNLPSLTLSIPLNDAIRVQQILDSIRLNAQVLGTFLSSDSNAVDIYGTALNARTALDVYLAEPTPTNIRLVASGMFKIQAQTNALAPGLAADGKQHRDKLLGTTRLARYVAFGAAAAVGSALLLMTLLLGRRMSNALAAADQKRHEMEATSTSLEYRNSQLSALYNVFTQITETLSLTYVVNTTTREVIRLMNADVAILRLLKDRQLVPAGSLGANGLEVEGLEPIELGEGLVGRTAQRGHALRVNEANADALSEGEAGGGLRSGLIVPLIVGARVVGVLTCWAQRENAFGEDDERIMEMIASQVATAVSAADAHETSVQNAHQDPLTGLSNRRQLDKDMADVFPETLARGEPTSVAMVDIDHFSQFNNNFGHKVGDITLQRVAHVLKSSIRESDRLYRYGGEEFLIVFDGGLEQGKRLAERLRLAVAETPHTGENLEPIGPTTISIGLAAFPEHGENILTIAELADAALLQAKEQGRNRVVVWRPTPAVDLAAA